MVSSKDREWKGKNIRKNRKTCKYIEKKKEKKRWKGIRTEDWHGKRVNITTSCHDPPDMTWLQWILFFSSLVWEAVHTIDDDSFKNRSDIKKHLLTAQSFSFEKKFSDRNGAVALNSHVVSLFSLLPGKSSRGGMITSYNWTRITSLATSSIPFSSITQIQPQQAFCLACELFWISLCMFCKNWL